VSLAEQPEGRGYYYESSDRAVRGFLHSDCFADMLCGTLYGLHTDSQAHGAAKAVIAEKASKSISLFLPRELDGSYLLDYRQFNLAGELAFQKEIPLTGFAEGCFDGLNDRLFLFLNEGLAGFEGKLREGNWLTVHSV